MSKVWPKDEVADVDERTTLLAFLGHQRSFLVRKAEGLTEDQARMATCQPSDLTMLGLIRHAAEVERWWAQRSLLGLDVRTIYTREAHPDGDEDGDFHPPPDATLVSALETLSGEIDEADRAFRAVSLDDIEQCDRAFYSVRWILVHLIEEYARHLGHADLIRQAIDGQTGDRPESARIEAVRRQSTFSSRRQRPSLPRPTVGCVGPPLPL